MYFFWYFSSHLCWLPRYLCLNRSCLSYLLPPCLFPSGTPPASAVGSGWDWQQPWEPRSALGAPVGQSRPWEHLEGALAAPSKPHVRRKPLRRGAPVPLPLSIWWLKLQPSISQTCHAFHTLGLYFRCFLHLERFSLPWGHPFTFQDPAQMSPPPERFPQLLIFQAALCASMTICLYLIITQLQVCFCHQTEIPLGKMTYPIT